MRAPVTAFFDTSFLRHAPLETIKFFLDRSEVGFITDRVLEELQAGYDSEPHDERLSSIFEVISDYRLRNNLRVISLKKCIKDNIQPDFNSGMIFFKKNSLLCSGYYAWLPCCVNPSMVTDPFRHAYNSALYTIRTKGDHDNEASTRLGRLRAQEIGLLERQGFKKGGFTVSALKKARKKRLKDIKRNNFKVTDYGLVVISFLYLCRTRKNVILLTCDYDLHDIKDNLIRSAIEKYTLNNLLTRRLKDHDRLEALETGNIRVRLTMEEIHVELNNVFKKITESKISSGFQVAFYDRNDGKLYGGVARIPAWLMDFVLDYRLNLICYSDYAVTEMKYPINYIMNPSEDLKQLDFNITLRKDRQYYGLIPDCEDICSPARRERDAPSGITSFVEKSDFDNRAERDFPNPWLNAGFSFFLLARYDQALSAFNNAIDLQHDCANGWYGKGISLGKLDRHEEAFAALDKATKLKPDHHEAFFCWGGILLDLSAIREGPVREALLEESAQKFSRAIEMRPDQPEVLHNWGNALMHLAAMREGTYRQTRLKEAAQKYAMAAGFNSEMPETLYGWGGALANLAALSEGPDRVALFKEAAEKYAKAVEIKPDMHEALYAWGNTLAGLATLPETINREALLREAIDKFAAASQIQPDMQEAFFTWGHVLRDLAALAEKPYQGELLREAAEKYGKAAEIGPDMHEAIYHWGYVLGNLAALHEGAAREELLRKEIEKYTLAAEIKPDMHEALVGWGYALLKIADLHEGYDREALLKKAVGKFAEAEEIRSDQFVLCSWGFALVLLEEFQEGDDREALLSEAVDKYDKAIEIEPNYYDALYNLCCALRMLAFVYKGRQRTETLEAALEKVKRIEDLKPGTGIYEMACIYALLGQEENALVSLKKAVEIDPQLRETAAGDEDFRSLWEAKAFKNIVKG